METFISFDEFEQRIMEQVPEFAMEELEEFAPSMEVQAVELREAFLDIPELQFENWQNLEIGEKVEALQAIENEAAEIANRPPMQVIAEELRPEEFGSANGERIVINSTYLQDNSYGMYRETMDTIFHEGRHGYQLHNVFSGEVVEQNAALVDSWRTNYTILGYDNGDYGDGLIESIIGYYRYESQPVEVDARAFADTVLRELNI